MFNYRVIDKICQSNLMQVGEFPALTLRRLLLEKKLHSGHLTRIYGFGNKALNQLLEFLGLEKHEIMIRKDHEGYLPINFFRDE